MKIPDKNFTTLSLTDHPVTSFHSERFIHTVLHSVLHFTSTHPLFCITAPDGGVGCQRFHIYTKPPDLIDVELVHDADEFHCNREGDGNEGAEEDEEDKDVEEEGNGPGPYHCLLTPGERKGFPLQN